MPNDPRDWAPQPPRKSPAQKAEESLRMALIGADLHGFDVDKAIHDHRLTRAGVNAPPTRTQALAEAFRRQGFEDPWLMAKKAQGHAA